MPVYAATATRPVPDLLAIVDQHPAALNGQCIPCGTKVCVERVSALHGLALGRHLPRRRPGASQPELINARRVRV
jgi:predicted NBD/HSP70 family sugar kinase